MSLPLLAFCHLPISILARVLGSQSRDKKRANLAIKNDLHLILVSFSQASSGSKKRSKKSKCNIYKKSLLSSHCIINNFL